MERIAIASDIDGTLIFHSNGSYTEIAETYFKEEDMAAIAAWQAKGRFFGYCTGRPPATVFGLLPDGMEPDFYIACNGAVILDRNRNIIYESVIKADDIRKLFERYKNSFQLSAFYTDSRDTLYRIMETQRNDVKQVVVHSLDDIRDRKLYCLAMFFGDNEEAASVCADINRDCPTLSAFQNKNVVDVMCKGCSKGDGILRIKKYLQADVMAGIGDSYNDLPMLLEAQPSFTFHSSPEDIRRQTDYVVDSVAEAMEILDFGI